MARKKNHQGKQASPSEQKKPGKIGQAESFILGISSRIGYSRLHQWMLAFLRPSEALAFLPEKPQPAQVAWNLLTFYFLFYLLFISVTSLVILPSGGANPPSSQNGDFASPQAIIGMLIVEPITNTAAMLFVLFLLYLCARLASGKSGYWRLAHAMSNAFCGWMALLTVIFVAAMLISSLALAFPQHTTVGVLVSAVAGFAALVLAGAGLIVFFWGLYSALRMVKAASGFSYVRAGISLAGTLAMMVVLNAVAFFIMTKLGV